MLTEGMGMIRPISELKGSRLGSVVYVIGTGASIDDYPPEFFKNKTLIGVNSVYKKFPVDYCVFTHTHTFREALGKVNCVVSDLDLAPNDSTSNLIDSPHNYHAYSVGKYCDFEGNLNNIGKNEDLCLGNSIAIPAIHFAAYLGASMIVLVGFDCCLVNSNANYNGYYSGGQLSTRMVNGSLEQYRHYLNDFFLRNVKELTMLRAKLREIYGCVVVSMSPYIGLKNNEVLLTGYVTPEILEQKLSRGE